MQFDVYEFNEEQVLKIPRSFDAIMASFLKKEEGYSNKTAAAAVNYYIDTRSLGISLVNKENLNHIFANSTQIHGNLLQDKIIPFSEYLLSKKYSINDHELITLCQKAVKINFSLWNLGIGEITFGMDKYGINKQRNLVLYDPFEMTDYKDDLKYLIKNKWWIQCNRFYPENVQAIIHEIFNNQLTIESLERHFNENTVGLHCDETRIQPIKDFVSLQATNESTFTNGK
jgi:hypothetical protein